MRSANKTLLSFSSARFFDRALLFLLIFVFSGCAATQELLSQLAPQDKISVNVEADGNLYEVHIRPESTVKDILDAIPIQLYENDRVFPDLDEVFLTDGKITVTRVRIEEVSNETVIPFESQTIRSENLPDGEIYLVQAGIAGKQQTVTRSVYEDGILTRKQVSEVNILEEARPEILMMGAKAEHTPIHIPGKLIYISNGSAWKMEGSTEDRTPLITTGDLDGRILDISSNGKWLLFSRNGAKEGELNSLWMLNLEDWGAEPISLRVGNVIRFAAWLPGDAMRFIYSTVTPSEETPGWKANNDLWMQVVSDTGMLMSKDELIPGTNNGPYSWWGREYRLSPDGREILYASADEIGIIDRLNIKEEKLLTVLPYEETRSDWAWIPGISWNPEGNQAAYVFHGEIDASATSFKADDYHIGSLLLDTRQARKIADSVGIFSYPSYSPRFTNGNAYIAYLQTITPKQADSERYRIMLMNEKGENVRAVYPTEGSGGFVTPQQIIWSPSEDQASAWLSFLSQGNLWLVNPFNGIYNQITSDNSITAFIWK